MDAKVAKRRIGEVIRVDTITNSQADFMATHVELKKIQIARTYEGKAERELTEEDAFNQYVLNPDNAHQLILVVGLSGTGKSHLIRWFSTKIQRKYLENEVVLFIRRSDNSLKGTIKQLLELEEVAQIPDKEVYERLMRATTVIDNKKLKDMIYQNFIVEIMNDENDEILTHHKKKRLVSLLRNDSFQARLLEYDKAIDRIYQKVAQSRTGDSQDVVALFQAADFYIDAEFCEGLIRDEADRNARIMAQNLVGDESYAEQVAKYMNTLVNNVIQTCAGLEPGDFEQVFLEIRRELKRQGKSLTLLIEDITAFTGVNVALLNVLSLENTGMYGDLCRISSIIGTTTAYFEDVFPANYRERVNCYMRISDEAFGSDKDSLCEFVGKYLNAMSLQISVLEDWLDGGGHQNDFPIHIDVEGKEWEHLILKNGKRVNLFPFTRTAVIKLFSLLPERQQTPRYLLRDIVERGVRNYLAGPDSFPSFTIERSENYPWNPVEHRGRLMQFVRDSEFERMDIFIRIWGNGTLFSEIDSAGQRYLGGVPEQAFDDLNMEKIPGIEKNNSLPGTQTSDIKAGDLEPATFEPRQKKPVVNPAEAAFQLGIETIYKWMQGGTLNFDSTKKDAKMMQQSRDEMNRYIYNAINWQIEGISVDSISKYTSKEFIGFERQNKKMDKSLLLLPASPETQSVLEAFLAFVTFGDGKTWDFEGGPWRQFQIQLWFEKIKPRIIEKVRTFNGYNVDYQECAISAEMLREILAGQYKGSTVEGMGEKLLWETSVSTVSNTSSHCKEWISLMNSVNDTAQKVKDTILDYYNIVQGTGGKNKYIDHKRLNSDFKKVQKRRLHMEDSVLSEKDPFKLRQDIRNIFRDIQGKLQKVSSAELECAKAKMGKIAEFIEYQGWSDSDILSLAEEISDFYDGANFAKVNIKYEANMINAVKRDAEPIANALKNVDNAILLKDPLDILMAFSQDPLVRIDKLLILLEKVDKDIKFVRADIEKRKEKVSKSLESIKDDRYGGQRLIIQKNIETVEGWEG